jgi:outer membrane protein OmpA-like peptidoglycan-associated protein
MPQSRARSRLRARLRAALVASSLGAALLGATTPSSADSSPSLALEPVPAGDRGFVVERAGVRDHLIPSARIYLDYASEPLVLTNLAQETDYVISHQAWLHALATLPLYHRVALSVDMPFIVAQGSGPELSFTPAAPRPDSSTDVGDLRFSARVSFYSSPEHAAVRTDVALSASVWFPTATEGYGGDGVPRFRASLLLEGATKRFYWAANAGLRGRPTEDLPGATPTIVGNGVLLGAGAGVFFDARRHLAFGVEFSAELTTAGKASLFDPYATTAHFLGTGHYRVAGGPFELGAAFGPGIGKGVGSAGYRALFYVGYAPESEPSQADTDRDGVLDKSDACPSEPGPQSEDPLEHGCPLELGDTDGDTILDPEDACPTRPGPATFHPKTHGCPTVIDTDKDGVPDGTDACPREPGEGQGNGCPKRRPPPVATLDAQEITISQQVQFELNTAVLRSESDPVLAEVMRVLKEHPEVELVEIEGHTDETGTEELNQRLGQERANSVLRWLVARGVARDRLVAKGYGSERPLDDNSTDEGRRKNRRVEFRVIRRKAGAPAEAPEKDSE